MKDFTEQDTERFDNEGGAIPQEPDGNIAEQCPVCLSWTLIISEGCLNCLSCGYSLCEI